MAEIQPVRLGYPDARSGRAAPEPGLTAWESWLAFAALVMGLKGVLHVLEGFSALRSSRYYTVPTDAIALPMSYSAWGWSHILVGVVVGLAGVALWRGRMWGRVVAVVVAVISILANFSFMSAAPAWSIVGIVLGVLVVYAVVVHGGDLVRE